jgi:hypothetical protein
VLKLHSIKINSKNWSRVQSKLLRVVETILHRSKPIPRSFSQNVRDLLIWPNNQIKLLMIESQNMINSNRKNKTSSKTMVQSVTLLSSNKSLREKMLNLIILRHNWGRKMTIILNWRLRKKCSWLTKWTTVKTTNQVDSWLLNRSKDTKALLSH